jgi:hypothetical protein
LSALVRNTHGHASERARTRPGILSHTRAVGIREESEGHDIRNANDSPNFNDRFIAFVQHFAIHLGGLVRNAVEKESFWFAPQLKVPTTNLLRMLRVGQAEDQVVRRLTIEFAKATARDHTFLRNIQTLPGFLHHDVIGT